MSLSDAKALSAPALERNEMGRATGQDRMNRSQRRIYQKMNSFLDGGGTLGREGEKGGRKRGQRRGSKAFYLTPAKINFLLLSSRFFSPENNR